VDDGSCGSIAERESGYWLLDEGILDLKPGTSSAREKTFTLHKKKNKSSGHREIYIT
jgi:hypothetical protein